MNSDDDTIEDKSFKNLLTESSPELYSDEITLSEKISIVVGKLRENSLGFTLTISYIGFLRRLLGDEEITEEVAQLIMENGVLDLLFGFFAPAIIETLDQAQQDELTNEVWRVVNGLTFQDLDFIEKYKIYDGKYGIINFVSQNLQNYENGIVLVNTIMVCGNIAFEPTYRNWLRKTNFLMKCKSILVKRENLALVEEALAALRNYVQVGCQEIEAGVIVEGLSEWLFIQKSTDNNPFHSCKDSLSAQVDVAKTALEVLRLMTESTDILEEANDYGILMKLSAMLVEDEIDTDMETDNPTDNYKSLRFMIVAALGALTSSDKCQPIDELLEEGILDTLFKVCDTSETEILEKILWVATNIAVSSKTTAQTVKDSELFEYAMTGLFDDQISTPAMKNEAVLLLVNTFSTLPENEQVEFIHSSIGVDWSQFLNTLVKALAQSDTEESKKWILTAIKDIFDISAKSAPQGYQSNFLADVLDEFASCGGPETIEPLTYEENSEISKLSSDISHEYLNEAMDQLYDEVSNDMNSQDIKF